MISVMEIQTCHHLLTLVDRPPFGPAIGPGSFQNRDQCLHRQGNGPGSAVQGQRSRFMWGNGPGWWQQPGPMLRRPTRGPLGGFGPCCCPQRGLLPCLYMPIIQHFATLLKKFQDCVWGGVGARIFSLIAHQVFDEMSKPHLGPQNTVSSAEVSNLIFSICN